MLLRPRFLLDTGPLVAYFNPRDPYHEWAHQVLNPIEPPLATCEPVLAEAFHLLAKFHNGIDLLCTYCASMVLQIDFRVLDHARDVQHLIRKYRDLPMDLSDACLVLLAEQHPHARVITIDRDFLTYRTRSRRQIPLIAPFSSGNN